MSVDLRDRRVLAALRVRDPLRDVTIVDRLEIAAPRLTLRRNRSALHVVVGSDHPGLRPHLAAFAAPPLTPAVGDVPFSVTVSDPARRWLPRVKTFALPRDADPALRDPRLAMPEFAGDPELAPLRARLPDSLFAPIDVPLLPAPAQPVDPWWCALRARVVRLVDGAAIGVAGALLRVTREVEVDGEPTTEVLAVGMSDERGEALVVVPGLPAHTFAGDHGEQDIDDDDPDAPVVTPDVAATLDAIWDPTAGWPLDPDALDERRGDDELLIAQAAVALRAGAARVLTLTLQPVP